MLTRKSKAAALSIATSTSLVLLKLVVGIITGSISLIAAAIDSIMDLIAAVVAFISVRVADTPADGAHPFGHGKAENISGVAEGLLIFIAAGLIINEAIHRLIRGTTLEFLEVGIGIMAVSIVVDVVVSRYLLKVSRETGSLALEADARNLSTDVMTMGGILVGLVIVRLTGLTIFDPIIAILVAGLIVKAAYDITRKSISGLMDTKLSEAEEAIIRSSIMEYKSQVVGFHKLRTRKAGSERHIDFHLIVPPNFSVTEAHELCDQLEREIGRKLKPANVTIHIEPCTAECEECSVACAVRKD